MTRDSLNAAVAVITLVGSLMAFGAVAWIVHTDGDTASAAALSALAMRLFDMSANVVRNRFPGPEIDVQPKGTPDA